VGGCRRAEWQTMRPAGPGPLTGKTLVITGTLSGWSRDAAHRTPAGARGQGHRFGVQEDRLPDRRGERRLASSPRLQSLGGDDPVSEERLGELGVEL
jgi:hypothetical protein